MKSQKLSPLSKHGGKFITRSIFKKEDKRRRIVDDFWQLFQYYNIGIKHGLSCINIRQVPWEVLKTEAEGRGFQHLPRDLANVNALINHVRSLLLHKN